MRRSHLTRLLAVPLLLTGVAATGAEAHAEPMMPAAAAPALQDCGDWRYPVLCRVELRVNDGTSGWQDYDPDDRLAVPPRGDLDIEVSGRDQDGRSFPQDRLALGFDDRDCGGLLEVEQRDEGALRISARRPDGECRLDMYVPGNLNFAWRIDVQVRRDMATNYERGQAETIVRALYRGILGREVDGGSFAAAVSEIQRGNLETQVAGMFRSGEFTQSLADTSAADLLARFYQGLLERAPDSTGTRDHLPQLQRRRYAEVVLAILRSDEFEERFLR